jgi:hypothetical protein
VLLANTYAATGDYNGSQVVYEQMRNMGIKKIPGITSVFVNNTMHTFFMDDQFHPQREQIVEKWQSLYERLLEAGYLNF